MQFDDQTKIPCDFTDHEDSFKEELQEGHLSGPGRHHDRLGPIFSPDPEAISSAGSRYLETLEKHPDKRPMNPLE
ncbi:hypothetical protein NDU88_007626 [Pleurodeles waltl]|uniref:Uncharacterized protein n=1 Tax=Pleurodeles waltl TaxID=8319 RepID=A0AAV7QME7_PLEWA|nr:hypothetical protein NDU88_007626 [Pleurodeles waltl]